MYKHCFVVFKLSNRNVLCISCWRKGRICGDEVHTAKRPKPDDAPASTPARMHGSAAASAFSPPTVPMDDPAPALASASAPTKASESPHASAPAPTDAPASVSTHVPASAPTEHPTIASVSTEDSEFSPTPAPVSAPPPTPTDDPASVHTASVPAPASTDASGDSSVSVHYGTINVSA